MTARRSNVVTIPSSLPFLRTLVDGLCDGRLVEGFAYNPSDPLSLADITIFLPTRRAVRVLRSEFIDRLGGRSAILPVIRALGETEDDSGFFDADLPATFDLMPPLPGAARLIELARLILLWRNRLPQAVLDVHFESPLIAPVSPADAIWLAHDLAALIDAIETEGIDWARLDDLDTGEHARWWQLTLEFLKIARDFWPARLDELRASSPVRHRNAVLSAETARMEAGGMQGYVIIAGSTGSIPATAGLIAAVQRLSNGTIVLPGLDTAMSDEDWSLLSGAALTGESDPADRGHPQYGLFRLLQRMALDRDDVTTLGLPEAELSDRAALLSLALLPADATDQWTRQEWRAGTLEAAFADVALVETANEREEATVIAIALRLALSENDESQAALITPDRDLARRVSAELARFGIDADDSAGTPLSATPAGQLMRQLLETALRPGDPVAIAALLKHPLARFGLPDEEIGASVPVLERLALRGGTAAVDVADVAALALSASHRIAAQERKPDWFMAVTDDRLSGALEFAARVAEAVEPLVGAMVRRRDGGGLSLARPLSDWARRTGRALEAVARDDAGGLARLWSTDAGEALATLLSTVIETDGEILADGGQWCDIVEAMMAGETVKPDAMRHPRVFIFGALEARLQSMDLVVLGGMNEGIWPGTTANDPFLSRSMKTGIGLEPPERRIGQLAHDLQMAFGTRHLVITRAMRNGATPTVASRWLQRLLATVGAPLAQSLRQRGRVMAGWAARLDEGIEQTQRRRPEPKVAAALQPRSYSFSEVGRLRRDPYSVYARRILKLDPVDPFNADPGAAERGTLYHAVVDRFMKAGFDPASNAAFQEMDRIFHEAFDAAGLPPHIDLIWRQRFAGVARAFILWERARADDIRQSFTEVRAGMPVGIRDIRLTGIADRIDILADGSAVLIDYKTGSSPSVKEARVLLEPQLALEAAALAAGAFDAVGRREARALLYVRLKPGGRFAEDSVNNDLTGKARGDIKSAPQLGMESLGELSKLLIALTSQQRGFASRLIIQKERQYGGEYDHLARVAEWASVDQGDDADDG